MFLPKTTPICIYSLTLILLYKGISEDPTCVYFNSLDINDKAEQEVWRTERLFD